jgi:hypothetical protein
MFEFKAVHRKLVVDMEMNRLISEYITIPQIPPTHFTLHLKTNIAPEGEGRGGIHTHAHTHMYACAHTQTILSLTFSVCVLTSKVFAAY